MPRGPKVEVANCSYTAGESLASLVLNSLYSFLIMFCLKNPEISAVMASIVVKRGHLVRFFQSYDITLVPLGSPRGEGISQFSQILRKSALKDKLLYTDDSCEIMVKC